MGAKMLDRVLRVVLLAVFAAISYGFYFLAGWADSLPTDVLFAWSLVPVVMTAWVVMMAFVVGEPRVVSSMGHWGAAFGCAASIVVLAGFARDDFRILYLVAMLPVGLWLLDSLNTGMHLDLMNAKRR